jgi:hypothetical protein
MALATNATYTTQVHGQCLPVLHTYIRKHMSNCYKHIYILYIIYMPTFYIIRNSYCNKGHSVPNADC